MKSTVILLSLFLASTNIIAAAEKNDNAVIAKSIQCSYLREKSFLNVYELYSVGKENTEYIKKVSDNIYSQAFKICDPENTPNADKEILGVCTTGCDQFVSKSVLGIGGSTQADIEQCKKMCLNYSDHLSHNYNASIKAIKKYIEMNPPAQAPVPASSPAPAPTSSQITPASSTTTTLDKKAEEKI